jgi:hypothetical protein
MNRHQKKKAPAKGKAQAPAPIPGDDPNRFKIKSVDDKHNVFNRKLLRKAKRQGVKDVAKFLEDSKKKGNKKNEQARGKGFQDKKQLKDKQKLQKINRQEPPPKPEDLNQVYTEQANKDYLKSMIEDDDREIQRYEKLLGIKSKKRGDKEKRMFKDMMADDDEEEGLFDFLDGISKKVHSNETFSYSKKTEEQAKKNSIQKKKQVEEEEEDDEEFDEEEGEEGDFEDMEGMEDMEDMEDMEGMEDMEDMEGEEYEEEGDEGEGEGVEGEEVEEEQAEEEKGEEEGIDR